MFDMNFSLPKSQLKQMVKSMHPYELSEVFNGADRENQIKLVEVLEPQTGVEVFLYLDFEDQEILWSLLSINQRKYLISHAALDDLKDFVSELSDVKQKELFKYADKKTIDVLKKLMAYEVTSAGSISSPHFIMIKDTLSIKEATQLVITYNDEQAEIEMIFIIDDENRYKGIIHLKELIVARSSHTLSDVIDEQYPTCLEYDLVTKVIKKIKDYDLNFIPVLNEEQKPIGIISAEDAFEYLEEVHKESFTNMVAVSDHDIDDSAWMRSYKRIPWLLISVILNLLIAGVLQVFSGTLQQFVALVMFQPLILGMAGNIGTQSLAVTILGIHSGAISAKKHMKQELLIGLINSLIIGVAGILVVFGFFKIAPHIHAEQDLMISVVVGLSLFGSMFLSALIGVLLPFGLRKIGVDDKIAGGPIISTFNDFVALGLYFLIATILLVTLT